MEAAELLGQLLMQDVARQNEGPVLTQGVSKDRIPSVHASEMRHRHKSSSKRFDGHQAAVAVDTDSQLITAVDLLPGNASDNTGALELIEQIEANTGLDLEETKGRPVTLHPQESLLQQVRAFQNSEAFIKYRGRRQVVEHRLARLVQLGIRQFRYFGRAKTRFQLLLAATVANLMLVASRLGFPEKPNHHGPSGPSLISGEVPPVGINPSTSTDLPQLRGRTWL